MIMAAACFPDAQARVQKELDTVVGIDRCKLNHPPHSIWYQFILPDVSTGLERLERSSSASCFHLGGAPLAASYTPR